ncbi:RDD family protein [Pseudonocardia broussonetiae]|uniref:RDD family protein n=1 Tax=Pseudonocardia broussonetiae TaxID=2736640 RepID=A0A6M6JPG9_9PSEU|nr:RDD family protein [Pseudonocardia broussonetiae]QJY49196.1 RDD family protein [Pseudonocardia broussonetiae]
MSAAAPPDGSAAGAVTRLLAAVLDLLAVLLLLTAAFLGVAAAGFLVAPLSFRWPTPPPELSILLGALLAVGYLTVGWATTGRTGGAAVLGLRVLSSSRGQLGWGRALVRAVLCVVFPLGLLWSAVSRERRSLQDAVVRSAVVYDWHGARTGTTGLTRSR